MEVSWNRGSPTSSIFERDFPLKPSILAYHHLWRPPYISQSYLIILDNTFDAIICIQHHKSSFCCWAISWNYTIFWDMHLHRIAYSYAQLHNRIDTFISRLLNTITQNWREPLHFIIHNKTKLNYTQKYAHTYTQIHTSVRTHVSTYIHTYIPK